MDFHLFNAILSMDVYNRGYGGSIQLSDVSGTKIGNVDVLTNSTLEFGGGVDSEIGFYAVAYDVGGAGTIIAYRGTDNLNPDPDNPVNAPDDAYHGWSLGGGLAGLDCFRLRRAANDNSKNRAIINLRRAAA